MSPLVELQRSARKRLEQLRRQARDPRCQRVMGRFVREGLLFTNHEVVTHDRPLEIEDVLWAGRVEPRLLELLPALIVKRPGLFSNARQLPEDLAKVVAALRRNHEPPSFRGIPGRDIHGWLTRVGRRGKVPARLKSFRFTVDDQRLLEHLSKELGVSETEVLRRGLRALSDSTP